MSISSSSEIIQKVKDFLDIDYEIDLNDLYETLYKYRTKVHPDLYRDVYEKSKAENRFKECYRYLDELSDYIKRERRINPKELTIYDKEFEVLQSRQEMIKNEKELEEYKSEIQNLQLSNLNLSNKVTTMESEMKTLRTTKISEKAEKLLSTYRPTSKDFKTLGVTIVLSMLIAVLTQIEQITSTIIKYSPVDKSILNSIVFSVFVVVVALYLKKFIEHKKVEKYVQVVQSQKSINGFYEYLVDTANDKEFSDFDVYLYIELRLKPRGFISKYILARIINVNKEETYEVLKEIFIYNLLIKSLVEHVGALNLNQKFKIKKSNSSRYDEINLDFEF